MQRFADVVLPVPLDRTFTYLIPPDLAASAAVGCRVIVPFGRRYVTGLIVGFPATGQAAGIRPVRDVIDVAPVLSPALLSLCRWMAEYYMTPLGEVVRAAIPHGFTGSAKRRVRLLAPDPFAAMATFGRDRKKHADVIAFLSGPGHALSTEIARKIRTRTINPILNDLALAGLVELEDVLPEPRGRPKIREFAVITSLDLPAAHALAGEIPPTRKQQTRLLATLLRLNTHAVDAIMVSALLKEARVSSTALKGFRHLLTFEHREISREAEYGTEAETRSIVLNDTQRSVRSQITAAIDKGAHATLLLHGVTGSGKTQVYIEAIRHCLDAGKSAIVLVPEISLTPQTVRRFKSHFAELVGVVHSRMAPGERRDVWRRAAKGTCRIVIGPRSAVFAPLQQIGLVVVDEEHESSYKQFDSVPRYHARDVAIVRGSIEQAAVVLGSATPSIESYFNAASGKYALLEMPQRIDNVVMPSVEIVDMGKERKREYEDLRESLPPENRKALRDFKASPVSRILKEKILERLERREGIILLQNRRGFAPFVECPDCGFTEMCDHCNVTMTYHLTRKHLRCHYCGATKAVRNECPTCHGWNIRLQGLGTQKVEQVLVSMFPGARVIRMDLDTTARKGAHDRLLRKFGDRQADILLGTQMVAKGLDFPHVTLVGVISADTQMLMPDFRSSERTFQLLTQVAGRAGRSTLRGEVIIQTHQSGHYTLQHVVDHDYAAFYREELEEREPLSYPPYSRLVLIETRGRQEPDVRSHAEKFAALLKSGAPAFSILGATPAVIDKVKDEYRWHVILKNPRALDASGAGMRAAIRAALTVFERSRKKSVRLIVDVDPTGMM